MRPEEDTFGRCDGVRGFRAGVIEESRVPLLRHGGRNISVVASFRKKEPGAGLRVLRHDAADHFPDMETDRGYDAGEFADPESVVARSAGQYVYFQNRLR